MVYTKKGGHRDNDLEEDARFRSAAVQLGGTRRETGTVSKALADQAQTGGTGIDHDQARVGICQVPMYFKTK